MLKKLILLSYLSTLFLPTVVMAQEVQVLEMPGLLISEVQTANETAGQEFVELYNASDEIYSLDELRLQYASSAGETWRTRIEFDDTQLEPWSHLLLGTEDYLQDADFIINSGMAASGGHLRLVGPEDDVIDLVGWGTAEAPDDLPAAAPGPGESIERLVDDQGVFIDSDNNLEDFELMTTPTPTSRPIVQLDTNEEPDTEIDDPIAQEPVIENPAPEPETPTAPETPAEDQPDTEQPETEDEPTPGTSEDPELEDPDEGPAEEEPETPLFNFLDFQPLIINELLPDPASPQTDADDEFVELFNPNNNELPLDGLSLQTGSQLGRTYNFLETSSIGPLDYFVIYSANSNISLPNGGGSVALQLPSGELWGPIADYSDAQTGRSYSLVDGVWEWSDTLTPAAANIIFTEPEAPQIPDNGQSSPDPTPENPLQTPTTQDPVTLPTATTSPLLTQGLPIEVTELLPDPVSPQTDANDEFVELYNPNPYDVPLDGLRLESGSNFRSTQALDDLAISAMDYIVLRSADYNISLSNAGGTVRLTIDGDQYGLAAQHPPANTGQSYSKIDGQWVWSLTHTPGSQNILQQNVEDMEEDHLDGSTEQDPGEESDATGGTPLDILPLLITEIFPDPASPQTDADDEFIELFNPNNQSITLDGFFVESGSNFNARANLEGLAIEAQDYLAISSAEHSMSLTNSGGEVRITYRGELIGTLADYPEAETGASYSLFGEEWQWTTTPTPGESNVLNVVASASTTKTVKSSTSSSSSSPFTRITTQLRAFEPLVITELLPDPASPQTDADDEFIELFNPNTEALDISGLVVQTGSSFGRDHTVEDTTIGAGEYLVLYSREASIALSNSGSSVRLVLSDGSVWGEVSAYENAKTGQSWALVADQWQWTTSPTPGAENALTQPESSPESTNTASTFSSTYQAPDELVSSRYSWVIVAGVVGVTVLYGGYEYRNELRNIRSNLRRDKTTGE